MQIPHRTWQHILTLFETVQKQAMHVTVASISKNAMPNITPIGTLFLDDQQQVFFFDRYTLQLSENIETHPYVCISAVNSSRIFWLKALLKGQFSHYPGVRLYAHIGEKRRATDAEKDKIAQRIKLLSWTKGSQMIWSEFEYVRDIKILEYRWIEYPKMLDTLKSFQLN